MKILIAPDKFKYTLSSEKVSEIIFNRTKIIFPDAEIIKLPLADGGEGTAKILAEKFNAKRIIIKTYNPIFEEINSSFYYSEETKTAFIDLSAASGLKLLKLKDRNPLHTSTYGTGKIICRAVEIGAKTIYLAVGGSATNDAGCGAAESVGYKFYDKNNNQITHITGKDLIKIDKIDTSEIKIDFNKTKVIALYDVSNFLHGKSGAAYIYSGQKGANPGDTEILDKGLKHFAEIVRLQFGINVNNCLGCGAAGGFGAGAKVFFKADLKPGAETLLQLSGFNEMIHNVDIIITGEGKFDEQSLFGKLTGTIILKAKEKNIPIILICGTNDLNGSITSKYKHLHILPLYDKFPGEKIAKQEAEEKLSEIFKKYNFKIFL